MIPDTIYTPEVFNEAQIRSGVQPVDELLAERHALVQARLRKKLANKRLVARHAFSTSIMDTEKKMRWSMALLRIRHEALSQDPPVKYTEEVLKAMAYASPEFTQCASDVVAERALFIAFEAEVEADGEAIDAITERIRRGALVMKAYTYEPRT